MKTYQLNYGSHDKAFEKFASSLALATIFNMFLNIV